MNKYTYRDLAATCEHAAKQLPIITGNLGAECNRLDFLTSAQFDNQIADMMLAYCKHGVWNDMPVEIEWQLAFRLRFAQYYFDELYQLHPETTLEGTELLLHIAVALTDIWHVNAAVWFASLSGAEQVLKGQYTPCQKMLVNMPQLKRLLKKI